MDACETGYMNVTNKKDKRNSTKRKKTGSKNVALRAGKTSAATGNRPVLRREDYKTGKETLYIAPKAFITSRLRPIGNSRGLILNSKLIDAAGLNADADIMIEARDGVITIIQMKSPVANTDLSAWDKQFKAAIKKGAKPEGDLFESMANDFDLKEW